MKTRMLALAILLPFSGCSTAHHYTNAAAIREAKALVVPLQPGMKREAVEAAIEPLEYPYLPINISVTVAVQYLLRPGVWTIVKYGADGSLLFKPEELVVRRRGTIRDRYDTLPLSQVQ